MKRKISLGLILAIFLNIFSPVLTMAEGYRDNEDISAWALEAVMDATDKGFIGGYQNKFRPKNHIKRGEFTKILVEVFDLEMKGTPKEFKDVKKSSWYYDYVGIASSNKLVEGYGQNFKAEANISRQEMAKIISRALKLEETGQLDFKDKKEIASWALEDLEKVSNAGIMQGDGAYFRPKNPATREMATLVAMRSYNYKLQNNMSPEDRDEEIFEVLNRQLNFLREEVKDPKIASIGGEWSVIALNRGLDQDLDDFNKKYMDNLEKSLKNMSGKLEKDKLTEYSRVVMAVNAQGKDASNIGGYDLDNRLKTMEKPGEMSMMDLVFSLMALNNFDQEETDIKKPLVDEILKRELQDGGWGLGGDIDTGDVDVTAMVIQSLSAFKEDREVARAIDRGLGYLIRMQDRKGGYIDYLGKKSSESISQVIIALTSLGLDPAKDARFIKNGRSLVDILLDYEISGAGFKHYMDKDFNMMATEQGILALVSYERYKTGQTHLYDMTDLLDQ